MKIFIIGAVRNADPDWREALELHADDLTRQGHEVHLPHRDTDQKASGLAICTQNVRAMAEADEVHLFYKPDSQGTHFDMGAAFALGKPLRVISCPPFGEGKSYPRMAREWEEHTKNTTTGEKSCK